MRRSLFRGGMCAVLFFSWVSPAATADFPPRARRDPGEVPHARRRLPLVETTTPGASSVAPRPSVKLPTAPPSKPWVLTDTGAEVVDYAKFGHFQGLGTDRYAYVIEDREGLARAAGEGVYPNTLGLLKDPDYQKSVAGGLLEGNSTHRTAVHQGGCSVRVHGLNPPFDLHLCRAFKPGDL